MIALSLAIFAEALSPAADKIDIPSAYVGHWALDPKFCSEPGPANVTVSPRRIDFYERHGFLDLAQLDHAGTPPRFYGSFRWVELLHFATGVVRLELAGDKLIVTEDDDPDAPSSTAAWTRCPA